MSALQFAVIATRFGTAPVAMDASLLVRLEESDAVGGGHIVDVRRVFPEAGPFGDPSRTRRRGRFRTAEGEVMLELHAALEMRMIARRALFPLPALLARLEHRGVAGFILLDDTPHAFIDIAALTRAHDLLTGSQRGST